MVVHKQGQPRVKTEKHVSDGPCKCAGSAGVPYVYWYFTLNSRRRSVDLLLYLTSCCNDCSIRCLVTGYGSVARSFLMGLNLAHPRGRHDPLCGTGHGVLVPWHGIKVRPRAWWRLEPITIDNK